MENLELKKCNNKKTKQNNKTANEGGRRISELENRTIEITGYEQERKKYIEKS